EIEPALHIEHEIVGAAQMMAGAFLVQDLDRPRQRIDPFDPSIGIIDGWMVGPRKFSLILPKEAAIVADIEKTIRAHSEAVGSPARFGEDFHAAARRPLGDRPAPDLHEGDGAI